MSAIMKHDMKAILGEDFFKEEIRCEYLVSSEMKLIWAVLIDMYLAFAEVCEKYGLRYYVVWGSLLGAVRHNGFIPWDDDFDVAMPREDYDEFLKIAKKHFHSPLFLQTPYTDPGYFVSWAKLRNSTTTAISKMTNHRRFNQGLFFDIFPMDDCDVDKMVEEREEIYIRLKRLGVAMRYGNPFLGERQIQDEKKYWTDNPLKEYEEMEKIASSHSGMDNYYVAVLTAGDLIKKVWPKKLFEKSKKHVFENIEVIIPAGYDELLTISYGNYMQYPPVEKRGVKHDDLIFDPHKAYSEYFI